MFILDIFNKAQFIEEYWQQKPCLIKQFVPNFDDPIDEHDLAGLAQEASVDSRIISKKNQKWLVTQGPFTEFDSACQGDWSLLVQGVDRYIDDVDALCELVNFIPNWRFDDVMVSYSTKNAGVGAHIDEYDVFIIQGQGTRRWQVGLPSDTKTISPHPLLKQIDGFSPVIDEILQPGDAIYIPPKHPHNGVALEPCLNYSLGFRAPTNVEVLTGILDESDSINQIQRRYTDPELGRLRKSSLSAMAVSTNEMDKLKASIISLLDSQQANDAILQYLSRQGLAIEQDGPVFEFDAIQSILEQGSEITKLPGAKPIYQQTESTIFTFFIDGHMFDVDKQIMHQTIAMLNAGFIKGYPTSLGNQAVKTMWTRLVTQLVNAGFYFVFDQ